MTLEKSLISLQNAIQAAVKNNIRLDKKPDGAKALYNYEENQKAYFLNNLRSNIKMVKSDILDLPELAKSHSANRPVIAQIMNLISELDNTELAALDKTAKKLLHLAKSLTIPKEEDSFNLPQNMPSDIWPDLQADIAELNRCFKNNCYRSSIILCGRLMETALHRKYFEATNNDLLEKSPGIGLGNLIAKLRDKGIALDPALNNQIHLINQVRVFSVHKKKEAFLPTRQQAHATILYTLDVLEKLF
jgi:hypothetical protein